MRLVPFEEKHSTQLIGWVPDKTASRKWGGRVYDWPLTQEQITERQTQPEVSSFVMQNGESPIGFVEMLKVDEEEYRLCRVIISESAGRGKGYGKQLVRLAVNHLRQNHLAKTVSLAVFESNRSAHMCYESVGFKTTGIEVNQDDNSCPLLQMEMAI